MIEKREVTIRRLLTLAGLVALVSVGACDGSMTGLEEESVAALEAEGKIDGESAEALPEQEVLPERGIRVCGIDIVGPPPPPPLIFIDGERLDSEENLENLENEDIERIEVLKGEAAEELYGHLYGEEGASGVVLIYTKSAAGAGGTP